MTCGSRAELPLGAGLRVGYVERAADGRGDRGQVAFVGADDEITAPEGTLDDVGVNDVGGMGAASQRFRWPGPGCRRDFRLRIRPGCGRAGPGGGSPPALGRPQERELYGTIRRSRRARWRAHIRRSPRSAAVGRRIVGNPGHALCRVPGDWMILAAHSSASAISSGVNRACSASYWLTASRPARMVRFASVRSGPARHCSSSRLPARRRRSRCRVQADGDGALLADGHEITVAQRYDRNRVDLLLAGWRRGRRGVRGEVDGGRQAQCRLGGQRAGQRPMVSPVAPRPVAMTRPSRPRYRPEQRPDAGADRAEADPGFQVGAAGQAGGDGQGLPEDLGQARPG